MAVVVVDGVLLLLVAEVAVHRHVLAGLLVAAAAVHVNRRAASNRPAARNLNRFAVLSPCVARNLNRFAVLSRPARNRLVALARLDAAADCFVAEVVADAVADVAVADVAADAAKRSHRLIRLEISSTFFFQDGAFFVRLAEPGPGMPADLWQ